MELEITATRDGCACTIVLAGEVDVYTSPKLKQELIDAIEAGCVDIVIDLEGVNFIDSSGLGVLVSGLRRVKESEGTMRLVCTKDNILKIFRITGLDKVFPLFASVDEAADY